MAVYPDNLALDRAVTPLGVALFTLAPLRKVVHVILKSMLWNLMSDIPGQQIDDSNPNNKRKS